MMEEGGKKAKQLWRECSRPSWAMAACDKTAGLFWRMEFQQGSPVQHMKAALRRQISQSSVLLLLLHLYTHPQKHPTAGQRSRTKRSTAICPVWTTAIYASAKWKGQSKSVQEDLGKEVPPPPPLKKQQKLEQEQPSRRFLLEPSGSRKRAPVSPGFTTTGLSTNHLDRRIWPDYAGKGSRTQEKQSAALGKHMEQKEKQQKQQRKVLCFNKFCWWAEAV